MQNAVATNAYLPPMRTTVHPRNTVALRFLNENTPPSSRSRCESYFSAYRCSLLVDVSTTRRQLTVSARCGVGFTGRTARCFFPSSSDAFSSGRRGGSMPRCGSAVGGTAPAGPALVPGGGRARALLAARGGEIISWSLSRTWRVPAKPALETRGKASEIATHSHTDTHRNCKPSPRYNPS